MSNSQDTTPQQQDQVRPEARTNVPPAPASDTQATANSYATMSLMELAAAQNRNFHLYEINEIDAVEAHDQDLLISAYIRLRNNEETLASAQRAVDAAKTKLVNLLNVSATPEPRRTASMMAGDDLSWLVDDDKPCQVITCGRTATRKIGGLWMCDHHVPDDIINDESAEPAAQPPAANAVRRVGQLKLHNLDVRELRQLSDGAVHYRDTLTGKVTISNRFGSHFITSKARWQKFFNAGFLEFKGNENNRELYVITKEGRDALKAGAK